MSPRLKGSPRKAFAPASPSRRQWRPCHCASTRSPNPRHRILNPITDAKLDLLGEICRIREGARQLDLACGKAEMLSRWSARYGLSGVGVDISEVFLAAAVSARPSWASPTA
ncbi:hypothetical protein GCM10020219_093210 [Nonomuraea dietziae]